MSKKQLSLYQFYGILYKIIIIDNTYAGIPKKNGKEKNLAEKRYR